MTIPTDQKRLRERVRSAYSDAADRPDDGHPFPVGPDLAASLGYPPDLLSKIPAVALEAFAGVSNVSVFADIPCATTVLDLGCGAGLDSFIASQSVGKEGKVIGVDFSEAMLTRARRAAAQLGSNSVEFLHGDAEDLPIENASVDVALVNGLFNLNPKRTEIFKELARVMRPGGVLYGAELILRQALPAEVKASEANWFA